MQKSSKKIAAKTKKAKKERIAPALLNFLEVNESKEKTLQEMDRIAKLLIRRDLELTETREKREAEFKELEKVKNELEKAKSNLEIKVKERTQALEELTRNLEEQVKERTKELEEKLETLEKMNKIMIDRELKMVELKNKNKELKEELEKLKQN